VPREKKTVDVCWRGRDLAEAGIVREMSLQEAKTGGTVLLRLGMARVKPDRHYPGRALEAVRMLDKLREQES